MENPEKEMFDTIWAMTNSYLFHGEGIGQNIFQRIEGVINTRIYRLDDREKYLHYVHTTLSGREYTLRDIILKNMLHFDPDELETYRWTGLND